MNIYPMRHSIYKGAYISARLSERERQVDSFEIRIRNIAKHKMILRFTSFPSLNYTKRNNNQMSSKIKAKQNKTTQNKNFMNGNTRSQEL